ncbi:MAG TPA: roadblock/LC7 domain-containing protein [Candidatus Methanoperedens sp.]
MTTTEMLEKILNDLRNIGGIEASAIASRDGLIICSNVPQKKHAETFCAMSATMLGAAETAASQLGKGIPCRLIVESNKAKIIATGAGQKALLIVMTKHDASLGLILMEVDKASQKVSKILGS